jgi:hypothetical protein
MTTVAELRAKAKQLHELAQRTQDALERLGYVLQALALESEADAMERDVSDGGK